MVYANKCCCWKVEAEITKQQKTKRVAASTSEAQDQAISILRLRYVFFCMKVPFLWFHCCTIFFVFHFCSRGKLLFNISGKTIYLFIYQVQEYTL